MGKMEKTRKENHATKVTKIPKTKIWAERNRCYQMLTNSEKYTYQTLSSEKIFGFPIIVRFIATLDNQILD